MTKVPCVSRPEVTKAKEYSTNARTIINTTLDLFLAELQIPSLRIGKYTAMKRSIEKTTTNQADKKPNTSKCSELIYNILRKLFERIELFN